MFENFTEWLIYLVIEDFASVSNLAPQVIQAGDDQDAQHRAQDHPPGSRGADGSVSNRPSTGGNNQRKQTGNEGEGGHLNRPESQFPTFDSCVNERQALLSPLDGELHNQDGVFAKQTDQHDQTDLSIDVVSQSHRLQEEEGAEDSDWQRQNYSQRQDEALVLPDQYQIDEGDDDEEDVNRFIPRSRFVIRETSPVDVVIRRYNLGIGGNFPNCLDGLPGAVARSRCALDGGGGVEVETGDLVQPLLLLDRHERGVGNLFTPVVLDEYVAQILGESPELRLGLDEDLEELVEADEPLLPRTANEDVEVIHRCLDRHTLLHGDVVVDDQLVLRVVGGVEGEQVPHFLAFAQSRHELVGYFTESCEIVGVRRVDKDQGDTAGGTEAGNGGGFKELKLHVAHPTGFFLKILNDLACGPLPIGPVFRVDEAGARVRTPPLSQHLVASQRSNGGHFRDFFRDLFQFLSFGVGVFECGSWRCLENGVDDALVLTRDKASRKLRVDANNPEGKAPDDSHGQRAACDDTPQDCGITSRDLLDSTVKRPLEQGCKNEQEANRPPQLIGQIRNSSQDHQSASSHQQNDQKSAWLFRLARVSVGVRMGVGVRFENHGTEDGGQRQCHQTGEHDGCGHRDTELPVELTNGPRDERHRYEHRGHHQGDRNDRTGDLVQHLHARSVRR